MRLGSEEFTKFAIPNGLESEDYDRLVDILVKERPTNVQPRERRHHQVRRAI